MQVNKTILEPGNCYAFYRPDTESEIYRQLPEVRDYRVILKNHPRHVITEHNLSPAQVMLLSTEKDDSGQKYSVIHPSDIAKINMALTEGMYHLKPGLKHIHFGTATTTELVSYNKIEPTLQFITTLADKVMSDDSVMTIDLKPGCFVEKEYANIIRCGQFTELDSGEKPNPNKSNEKAKSIPKLQTDLEFG